MNISHFVFMWLMLNSIAVSAQTNEWQQIASEDGITISSRTADCSDRANGVFNDYLLLKVVNGNDHPVSVTFDRLAWFDNKCNGCQGDTGENRTVLELGPNAEQEGTCASREKSLKVFSKKHDLPNVAKLTRFDVGNLSIIRKTSAE